MATSTPGMLFSRAASLPLPLPRDPAGARPVRTEGALPPLVVKKPAAGRHLDPVYLGHEAQIDLRDAAPGIARRLRIARIDEALPLLVVLTELAYKRCPDARLIGIRIERSLAANFRQAGRGGGDDWAAGGHGLDRRQAETFDAGGKQEAERTAERSLEVVVANATEQAQIGRPVRAQSGFADLARHPHVEAHQVEYRRDAHEQIEVLVFLVPAQAQDIGPAGFRLQARTVLVPAQDVVAAVVGDGDLFGNGHVELGQMPARKLRD